MVTGQGMRPLRADRELRWLGRGPAPPEKVEAGFRQGSWSAGRAWLCPVLADLEPRKPTGLLLEGRQFPEGAWVAGQMSRTTGFRKRL